MEEVKVTEKTVEMLITRYKWRCSRCGKLPEAGEVWLRSARGAAKYCPKCAEMIYIDVPDTDEELEDVEVAFLNLEVIAWRGEKRK